MAPPVGQSPDAPSKAKQWEWMKRYRVWEANRKVFLYPENWLEPELRDNKSPFFKEVESELLQGDITDDAASVALLNYLSKLQEVAKLEPCGIHHTPANEELRTGEVNHVIARHRVRLRDAVAQVARQARSLTAATRVGVGQAIHGEG